MAVTVKVSCDGEACARRPAEQAYTEWAEGGGQEVWALVDTEGEMITIESGWLQLHEGWEVKRVPESDRYPDGYRFLCPPCAKGRSTEGA